MAVTFDQVGTIATGTSVASLTVADNATAGATVFLWIDFVNNTSITTGLSAKYAGVSMTQVGTTFLMGTSGGFNGYMACFVLNSAPGGGGSVVVTLPGTENNAQANTISYTGVNTGGGFTLSHNSSTGTALSISSVASASGDTVTNCGISLGNATFSSYNQTSRYTHNTTSQGSMVMGDAAGASTVSFSTTSSASAVWGMCAINMAPPIASLTPVTSTVTITTGTPTLSNANGLNPAAAVVNITGGTSTIMTPSALSPASATVTITRGTPKVPVSSGPFARVINGLNSGSDVTLQMIGDSTVWGYNDGNQTTLMGWVGRMGVALGSFYDVTVKTRVWDVTSSVYDSEITLHTGSNPNTIHIFNGGRSGQVMSYYIAQGNALIPNLDPDVIIIADGFNELSTSGYVADYETYLTFLQSSCPASPVIVTDQNRTLGTETSNLVPFASLFNALMSTVLPGRSPGTMNPPLQYSPAMSGLTSGNVWMLDTQQAYPLDKLSAWITGAFLLHPNSLGYAAQALWMLSQLDPAAVNTLTPSSATVTVTPASPTVISGSQTVILATTASVAITRGTPAVMASANSAIQPTGVTLSITTSVPGVSGQALVAAPLGALVTVAGGKGSAFIPGSSASYYLLRGRPAAGNISLSSRRDYRT